MIKKTFWTIWYFLALPFALVIFGLKALFLIMKSRKYNKNPDLVLEEERYRKVNSIISLFLFITRVKVAFDEDEINQIPKRPLLIIANHKSAYDPLVIFKALNNISNLNKISFVAKQELSGNRLVRAAMNLIDCILIDRSNLRQNLDAFKKQQQIFKSNHSICVFPEGTRIKDEKIGEFKAGAFKLAYDNLCPIQPLILLGNNPKSLKKFHREVNIKVLSTYKPNEFANVNINIFANNVQQKINKEYKQLTKKK